MAEVGIGIHRVIQDVDGEAATVTNSRLDVNATIVAGTSIDIGDVDIHLSGNVPLLGNTGSIAAGVLRVTIADDDNVSTKLTSIDTDTGNILTILTLIDGDTSILSSIKLAVQ